MPKKQPKKTSSNKPVQTKADFVRSLPADMPAKEVLAKAKEAKVSLTEDYVYKTRSLDKKGKAKKKATAAKRAVKDASATAGARGKAPDKKNRVLDLVAKNPTWSADAVAKAAKCSTTYVYSVWRQKPNATIANGQVARSSNGGLVNDFYRALKRVGVEKARELIANIEAYENA